MYKKTFLSIWMLVMAFPIFADIDITDLFLANASFDDETHFDYRKGESGNVAQEILPIYGWTKDISVDYTITGIYEYGTNKTFNTNGRIPNAGYKNSTGGCLALSTGWDQSLKFYQTISLPQGKYKLQTAFYNGSNTANGYSELAWIDAEGNSVQSSLSSFPLNQWIVDEVQFSLKNETQGKVQIGFRAVANGSANSAKVVSDFVKIFLVGEDASLINDMQNTLSETLSSALKLYSDGNGNDAQSLKNAIDKAEKLLQENNKSYIDLYLENQSLENAIEKYKWANSTKDNPLTFTHFIANPSFENGFEGWAQSGFKTQTNTSFNKKVGNAYIEKWVQNGSTVGNISLKQEINGLPIGHYTLIVSAHCLQDGKEASGAFLFGGENRVEISSLKDYILNFTSLEENLSIGILTQATTANWVAADNFRLYYYAATIDDLAHELSNRTAYANELLQKQMCHTHRIALEASVKEATDWDKTKESSSLSTVAKNLNASTQTALVSISAFDRLAATIAEAKALVEENGKDADKLDNALKIAESAFANEKQTVPDINATTDDLNAAILIYRTANASGNIPNVTSAPLYARGATMAFFRATFSGNDITERGLCYATTPNPTITDNRSTITHQNNGTIYAIEGLSPATIYYVRPYAITKSYAVGYGAITKICTLPAGEISWQYNNGGSDEENARIRNATQDAVEIWNNLTSIKGLHINVNYGAQTQTADCSYGGWMRVGPNASYQRTGTIQHEMAHAIGVGTIERWYNDGTYRENVSSGIWLGERTDQVLQFLDNSNSAHLKGDKTHFWPYGINGAHEDDDTRILYYANALIVQALGEDNLPPVSGAFASPAYTFTQNDDEYYYLMPADLAGKNTALLNGSNSSPSLSYCEWKEALNNHSFAWQIQFNPTTQLYDIRNVETNKSLSLSNAKLTLNNNPTYGIQMLGSREKIVTNDFNLKSYWLTFADGSDKPNALNCNGQSLNITRFDHRNSASSQRWILLSRKEIKALAGDFSELKETTPSLQAKIFNTSEGITLQSSQQGEWIVLCDIVGRTLQSFYMQANTEVSISLPKGIYVVNKTKVVVK